MSINAASLALIKTSEGFVDHWYPDPATGGEPWTCCYGHTSAAGEPQYSPKQTFTEAQGEAILLNDLAGAEAVVDKNVKVKLTDNERGALVSFVDNVGATNFEKSTMLLRLNAGSYALAAAEFPKWNHAAGKVMAGLTTRREAEMKLFLTPDANPNKAAAGPGFWSALIAAILSLFNHKV